MPITPGAYLFFPGSTERAIAFCQVFGGQITITRRGGVGPAASEAEKDQVVNALLTGGDVTFRAGYRDDAALDAQTRVELPVLGTGEPRLRALFDGLANGGTVRVRRAGRCCGGASAPAPAGTVSAGRPVSARQVRAGPAGHGAMQRRTPPRGVGGDLLDPARGACPCLPVSGDQCGPAGCLAARRAACC